MYGYESLPGQGAHETKEYQTCQPLIKENLETHEEKSRDSHFFQIKIKRTLILLGELIVYNNLVLVWSHV